MLRAILAILISAGILSCADTFKGRVSVKGNEPFAYLSLSTSNGEFKIVGLLANEIRGKYQNKYIEGMGIITKKAIGPGFPAELNITSIIKVNSVPF